MFVIKDIWTGSSLIQARIWLICRFLLCGLLAVLQAPLVDGVLLGPFRWLASVWNNR